MHMKSEVGDIEVFLCPEEKRHHLERNSPMKAEEPVASTSSQTLVYAQSFTSVVEPNVSDPINQLDY